MLKIVPAIRLQTLPITPYRVFPFLIAPIKTLVLLPSTKTAGSLIIMPWQMALIRFIKKTQPGGYSFFKF